MADPSTCVECRYFRTVIQGQSLPHGWGICKRLSPESFQVMAVAKEFYMGKWPIVKGSQEECGESKSVE